MWHCEPPSSAGDTQLEGAVIGEVPTVVAGCFAMPLCATGLALKKPRLHGESQWESDPLKIWKEVAGPRCRPELPALHVPHQPKESLRWISWDNVEARDPLMAQFLRCHFNLKLPQMQTCTLGNNRESGG